MTDAEIRKALGLDPESLAKTEADVRQWVKDQGIDMAALGANLVHPSQNTRPPPTPEECRAFGEATSCQHGQDVWDCPCGVSWADRPKVNL